MRIRFNVESGTTRPETEPRAYARNPVGGEGTPVVSPVLRVYILESHPDDEQHDTYLDHHDGGVETGALLDPDHQNGGDHQSDQECREIKTDFDPENSWRVQQLPRLLHEHRRLRADYLGHLIKIRLRAGHETRVGGHGHLPRHDILGGFQCGPMVVRQPQRHLDLEYVQQLDKVV